MRIDKLRAVLTTSAMTMIICAGAANAKLYKWVDENGQTHYGDRIPPQYMHKERKELSESGHVVKTTKRAKTEEEFAEEARLEAIAAERAAELKEQQRRDRVLLDTYTTERDLMIAKKARIEAVDSQLQLSNSIIESAQKKLLTTQKRIENIEKSNRQVPEDLYNKLEREKNELETHKQVAEGHQSKKQEIIEQFDGYIARFKELKSR